MLQQLLDPVPVATFLSEYWEKQPLYVARALPQWCRELPSIDHLDAIISQTSAPEGSSDTSMVRRDAAFGVESYDVERAPNGRPDMAAIYRAYAKGWTIALYNLHTRSTPVAQLASKMAGELGHDVYVNLYCTPSGAKGLAAHADSHDVIMLQLEGRKSWRLFAPQYLLPLLKQETVLKRDQLGAPILEAAMEPGQILYLPRGYIHEAVTTDVPSVHITIGVYTLHWLELLEAAVRVAAERDVRFRRTALSFKPSDESVAEDVAREFASLLQSVQGRDVVVEAIRRCRGAHVRNFPTSPEPHLNSVEQARSLSGSTVVVRRLGMRALVTEVDERVRIEFGERRVSAPPTAAIALEFVSTHERFRIDDLPGELSAQSKIVLVRRLIHEGLLRIAAQAD